MSGITLEAGEASSTIIAIFYLAPAPDNHNQAGDGGNTGDSTPPANPQLDLSHVRSARCEQ